MSNKFDIIEMARSCLSRQETKTKNHFKDMIKTKLQIMVASNDDALTETLRMIAKYNPDYDDNDGDNQPIKYCPHPDFGTMTICLFVNDVPISIGWNCAINKVWNDEKEIHKQSKEKKQKCTTMCSVKKVKQTIARGPGQIFKIEADSTFSEHSLSNMQSLAIVYECAHSTILSFDTKLRSIDDSIICVTVALSYDVISCLYVFQKRYYHTDAQNYKGSYHNNPIITDKMQKATEQFVIDIMFVSSVNACKAEEAVYKALVTKYGATIVPQIPVNGFKVVELTGDQERMISSFRDNHPCRPLMISNNNTSIF